MPKNTSAEFPDNIFLSSRAERELAGIAGNSHVECKRIVDDIVCLSGNQIPLSQLKGLPGMPGLKEMKSGRYRVVFKQGRMLEIVSVFPRKDQRRVFRSLK